MKHQVFCDYSCIFLKLRDVRSRKKVPWFFGYFQGFIGPPGVAGPPGLEGEKVSDVYLRGTLINIFVSSFPVCAYIFWMTCSFQKIPEHPLNIISEKHLYFPNNDVTSSRKSLILWLCYGCSISVWCVQRKNINSMQWNDLWILTLKWS